MQRKSTRKVLPVVVTTANTTTDIEGEKFPTGEESYGEPDRIVFKDVTFSNVLVFFKYLIMIFVIIEEMQLPFCQSNNNLSMFINISNLDD